jgi:hypothetical protein
MKTRGLASRWVASSMLLAALAMAQAPAWSAAIDLNTWSQQGPLANGTWVVAADGSSVFQSTNGSPTFFVSPTSYIDTTFRGKFGVETSGDNDFIGFIFGSTSEVSTAASNMFLFDWKQGQQSGSMAGFTLSKVTGGSGSIPFGNHQADAAGYDVLAADTGAGKGWADNTVYDFFLTYHSDRILIELGGGSYATRTVIFDLANPLDDNPSGAFGFYNFSQAGVRYQGFTENPQPPGTAIPAPASLALLGIGLVGLSTVVRPRTR